MLINKYSYSWIVVEAYFFLAKRTKQLLFEPIINTFLMELMWTSKCFHHLTSLKIIQANCTWISIVCFIICLLLARSTSLPYSRTLYRLFATVLFLFFVLKTWYRVYDVFYFFLRMDNLSILINIQVIFSFISIIFICIAVIVKIKVLTIKSAIYIDSNIWWTPTSKLRAIYILRNSIEEKLLICTIIACLKLIVLLIWSWILTVLSKKLLSIHIHLNLWILLKLIKDILHIIHYIWNINYIVWILRLLIVILRSSISLSLLVVSCILTVYYVSYVCQIRNTI
jgi:hypothetical protein